ncbi:MAG: ChaN family lipoprotein [Burkholderiales bacterium]|nr:ChaN family lipoprotein [Burkholderiales bacterium]
MKNSTKIGARMRNCTLGIAVAALLAAAPARAHEGCAAEAVWTIPGGGGISAQTVLGRATGARVVLLGESHDNADHHRWELQMATALATLHPRIVLGFEMFPRRVQAALDRWVAGELTEAQFLQDADWEHVWGYEADFYLPLFHFARMNRIPMLALNVERAMVRTVGAQGLAAVPPDELEGVSKPAEPGEEYLSRLFASYAQHPEKHASAPALGDPAFRRFVEAQLVWDRAMAQVLGAAAARDPDILVVGIMGARHVTHGDGVQHQLKDLGIQNVVSLLPWDHEGDCGEFATGLASAVYGIPYMPPAPAAPPPQLLGINIDAAPDGVRIVAVGPGSIAEAAGLQAGDVLTEAAGTAVTTTGELKNIVVRMLPGTWLPLKAKRNGEIIELTARFPQRK